MESRLIAEVTRGGLVESHHFGDIAVVDTDGNLVFSLGNPECHTFMRSASKPLQAIPLCESGALDTFEISGEELAVIVASHNAERRHLKAVGSILRKAGLKASLLECGPQKPLGRKAAFELVSSGKRATPIHNNCSGKHAGMLLLARHLGLDLKGYVDLHHPVQSIVMEAVSSMTSYPTDRFGIGIDGCGVPVYALPLRNMALAYARIARPEVLRSTRARAVSRIRQAMVENPYMVAGDERLCTDLMQMTGGRFVGKYGAEGVYCLASLEMGFGLALKVGDGSPRALGPVLVRVLTKMGALEEAEPFVERYRVLQVKNTLGDVIGEIRPAGSI